MQLLGLFSMRRFGSNLVLIYCTVVAVFLLLLVFFLSPQNAASSIASALRKSYDWGTAKLPTPSGYQSKGYGPLDAPGGEGKTKGDDLSATNAPPPSLATILSVLFEPLKLPITAPSWTASDGVKFEIPQDPVWTKPLGKRLCIVDIDTRPLNGTNDILNTGDFDWPQYHPTSAGMMGHYLYTQIHGYDYKFVRTHNYEDRTSYWTKISALSDTLRDYDFVISIDADAQISHPEIPFEWLLNRWNVTRETALTMTIDPDKPYNLDPRGRPYNNCGFVVAHNIPRTHEMLKAWSSCPDEPQKDFEGCARWKTPWPAEQAAFGEYIRYMFSEPNDLNEIPCDEANGFPESDQGCSGRFIRHLWTAKGQTRDVVNNGVMQVLLKRLHDQFLADESVIIERESNAFLRGDLR